MRSTVVVASTRESSRAAHAGQSDVSEKREKMKLPISLLVLAALSQALSVQPVTNSSVDKSSVAKIPVAKIPVTKIPVAKIPVAKIPVAKSSLAKSTVTKQKDDNQTSKRELYEGNFGDRNKEHVTKYEVTGPPPRIVYAKELQDMTSEQSPTHQIFGVRLPQIAKISDVLSGHGPSFEAAVAKHLYSPISVYHARFSSPTSFEVSTPAASQSAYSNPKTYKLQADAENEQKLQEVPQEVPKGVKLPSPVIPLYTVNQPRLRFEAHPQPLDSGLSRQHENLPQEIYRHTQQVPMKLMSSLVPIYDQLGTFRYPGQVVPSQFLHQNGLYQIVPARPEFRYGNQEENRNKNYYPNQENHEQLTHGQTNLQIDIPMPKQGYHAHPNGAISFARFSHNLPVNTNMQYETARQPQSETFHQPQPIQLQSQPIPVQLPLRIQSEVMLQTQEQKLAPVKQKIQIPAMFHRLIQDLEKYQPVYQQQPQFSPFKQQILNQPRMLNALQQHLLFQDPRQLSNPHVIQLQRLPAFKPLPQSLLSPESFLQQTSRSPVISERSPRPFSYEDQSTKNPEHFDQPLEPEASTPLTPLPPLKPNYSKLVKPLESQPHTTPVFLPTPLQPLPTTTQKQQPVSDQLISSTTVQPDVEEEESIQEEIQPKSQSSQPLQPEITHQSQSTVRPPSIQSTTYLPFVTHEPQSIHIQYSTPQPVFQSTIRPSLPRHDVVIQQQEIQELFFEPSSQLYQPQAIVPQQEREVHQLRTQPHHQLFEQLQPLHYLQEIQDINSQQYQLEARQSKFLQKPDSSQHRKSQQYQIQQHSHPFQVQHFQPKLLQSQQSDLEQSQQPQQVHQAQQQQHESEQAQQQASEQAQQQQASEQAKQQQYQQHLDSNNQIQNSLKPSQDTDKQAETVEFQQQPESQPQLQQQSNLQPTTGNPKEQPELLSEPTTNVQQPYLGPLLASSDLPQIYVHQQQLVAQPEYRPLVGVPSYSDVQYFGKFAESLFGNRHH